MKKNFRRIFIVLFVLVLVSIVSLIFFVARWSYSNYHTEKRIELKFWNEVQNTHGFHVKFFRLWEGDSMVTGEIQDKGEVRFWYGEKGTPNITSIAGQAIEYSCTFDTNGKHFTTGLDLSTNSPFVPLFGFEVNNLSDLVKNYDDLNVKITGFKNSSTRTAIRLNIHGETATCQFP